MKLALDLYFDMTLRKILTLVEIVLIIRILYITIDDAHPLPIASALIAFFILYILDRLVSFFFQFNAMYARPMNNKTTRHVLQCYISPVFQTPRRIASILFTLYALSVVAIQATPIALKATVMVITTLLLINHVFGFYLSLKIHSHESKKRS